MEVNGQMNGKSKAKGNEKRKPVGKGRKEPKDSVFVASNCESDTDDLNSIHFSGCRKILCVG